jgi:hypothetical protein
MQTSKASTDVSVDVDTRYSAQVILCRYQILVTWQQRWEGAPCPAYVKHAVSEYHLVSSTHGQAYTDW